MGWAARDAAIITIKRLQELLAQCRPDALLYAFDAPMTPSGDCGIRIELHSGVIGGSRPERIMRLIRSRIVLIRRRDALGRVVDSQQLPGHDGFYHSHDEATA